VFYEDFAQAETLNATRIQFVTIQQKIGGKMYSRYSITGTGPQWKTVSGIGCVVIPETDSEYKAIYENLLPTEITMHQHGQTPPNNLDGVPYLAQVPILPERIAVYVFNIYPQNRGSYFIHSHYGFTHGMGLSAPMIVQGPFPGDYPKRRRYAGAEEVVMFLEDFCPYAQDDPTTNAKCNAPMEVEAVLKDGWDGEADGFDFNSCMDAGTNGDVGFRHQMANSRTLDDPLVQVVAAGSMLRVRLINSADMSNYKVVFPKGLVSITLVAVDGQFVEPISIETLPGNEAGEANGFWLAVAQRADFMVQMPETAGVYPILAKSDGAGPPFLQSGIVLKVGADTPTGSYSETAPEKNGVGFMGTPEDAGGEVSNGLAQEATLRAYFPLSPGAGFGTADYNFNVRLTGDNGFHSINTESYTLVPFSNGGKLPFEPNKDPLVVTQGKRACVKLSNHNADDHAMHLHGHSFQVMSVLDQRIGGGGGAFRDTVLMPKGGCRNVTICFQTDNPGVWPFHCHMNYHMASGMLTTVEYGTDIKVADLPGSPTPAPPAKALEPESEWNGTTKALLGVCMVTTLAALAAGFMAVTYRSQVLAEAAARENTGQYVEMSNTLNSNGNNL